MTKKNAHANELPVPTVISGTNPTFPCEIARVWLGDSSMQEPFPSQIEAHAEDPNIYAWIIARLAADIAADFAREKNLDPAATKNQLVSHLLESLKTPSLPGIF